MTIRVAKEVGMRGGGLAHHVGSVVMEGWRKLASLS